VADAHPSSKQPRPRRRSGIVIPRKLKWYHYLAAWSIACGFRAISATWRCSFTDHCGSFTQPRDLVIFAVWHNRLALSMTAWGQWGIDKYPAKGLVALISASHDGGILSLALKSFGVEAVRGSSSRRGAQALLELTSWMERGYNVAITPDGPRGPRYKASSGIISLAQVTGHSIIPVTATIHGKLILKSWDRFQIPLPFARCKIDFGETISVPRDATPEQREELRLELERRLLKFTGD
jgi:lysophospholipid acyltransferase (LPLAT)-like uncharacterized protein